MIRNMQLLRGFTCFLSSDISLVGIYNRSEIHQRLFRTVNIRSEAIDLASLFYWLQIFAE